MLEIDGLWPQNLKVDSDQNSVKIGKSEFDGFSQIYFWELLKLKLQLKMKILESDDDNNQDGPSH